MAHILTFAAFFKRFPLVFPVSYGRLGDMKSINVSYCLNVRQNVVFLMVRYTQSLGKAGMVFHRYQWLHANARPREMSCFLFATAVFVRLL